MRRTLLLLLTGVSLAAVLVGCSEPVDVKRDHLDPESLKALEHPPPGVPGAPAKPTTPPGAPAATAANTAGK